MEEIFTPAMTSFLILAHKPLYRCSNAQDGENRDRMVPKYSGRRVHHGFRHNERMAR